MTQEPDPEIVRAPDGSPMITTEAKAMELGCSVPTLWRRVARGEVPAPTQHNKRAWFMTAAALAAAERRRKPPARARRRGPEAP
jgi:hypothetical protein